jgi:hypothetical protein
MAARPLPPNRAIFRAGHPSKHRTTIRGVPGTPDPLNPGGFGIAKPVEMAPGGIEPPHADSKSAALSTELRGLAASMPRLRAALLVTEIVS